MPNGSGFFKKKAVVNEVTVSNPVYNGGKGFDDLEIISTADCDGMTSNECADLVQKLNAKAAKRQADLESTERENMIAALRPL